MRRIAARSILLHLQSATEPQHLDVEIHTHDRQLFLQQTQRPFVLIETSTQKMTQPTDCSWNLPYGIQTTITANETKTGADRSAEYIG
jgi:hypothetical protein